MSARVISLVNFKGGVGKTALAVNVAVALTAQFGKEVLVVDLDPQSNASIWLMGIQEWHLKANKHKEMSVYGLLMGISSVDQCIVRSPVQNGDGDIQLKRLDLIPSSYHLMDFQETYRWRVGKTPWYLSFYRQLKSVFSAYEYILIDCPPDLYKTTQCAIFSADSIIVPCNTDALSYIGLQLLAKKVRSFGQQVSNDLANERPGKGVPLISGIIINNVQESHKKANRLSVAHFDQLLNNIKRRGDASPSARVFETRVRNTAAFKTGTFEFRPLLFTADHNESLLDDYRNIASLLINELGKSP